MQFFLQEKESGEADQFLEFEDWNIVLVYLLAMEGSNKTPYEPNNKNDATRHLRAMEGSSNKTPYEPNNAAELSGYGRV